MQRWKKPFGKAKALKFETDYKIELEAGVIAWHIDASGVVWTLSNNGKLANQIARFVAIAVKKKWTSQCIGEGAP